MYEPLSKTLWGYSDELCAVFHRDLVITSFEEHKIMNSPRSHRINMLLNILAMKLRAGIMNLFEKVLNVIQSYKKDPGVQEVATKLQETFDRGAGTYVYACTYVLHDSYMSYVHTVRIYLNYEF